MRRPGQISGPIVFQVCWEATGIFEAENKVSNRPGKDRGIRRKRGKSVKNLETEAWGNSSVIKHLPRKQEDPSSSPRTHVKSQALWCPLVIPALESWRQKDPRNSLDSQSR